MYLRKINNHTRSDLFLYYIIHKYGKTNSDSTRRVRVSFCIAKKTLGSVEKRTVLTNSRKCKAVDKNNSVATERHTFCNICFLEHTVRGDDVTSTSEVCYGGMKQNSTEKWGLVEPWAVS